jgi:hypothetical protein
MITLVDNATHLVELDKWAGHSLLTISRKADGLSITLQGAPIVASFRDALRKCGADRAINTHVRVAEYQGLPWQRVYKASTFKPANQGA